MEHQVYIAARLVAIPPLVWDDMCHQTRRSEEEAGISPQSYLERITRLSYDSTNGFRGLRTFLHEFRGLFGTTYQLIEELSDDDMNSVVAYIRERARDEGMPVPRRVPRAEEANAACA